MKREDIMLCEGSKIDNDTFDLIEESECVIGVDCCGLTGRYEELGGTLMYEVIFDDGESIVIYN